MSSCRSEKKSNNQYIFIPIDIDNSLMFKCLVAKDKIDLIATRIEEICKVLAKEKPDAEWIVLWREYGICEDTTTNSITYESRSYLKDKMKAISKSYSNLTILAGTTLVKKVKPIKHLYNVLGYYDALSVTEMREIAEDGSEIDQNREQILRLLGTYGESKVDVNVYANKARIYHAGEELRHGKVAPYEEVDISDTYNVYQPGKGNNRSPHFEINPRLSFCVSICREYFIDVDEIYSGQTPLFHLLIADGMGINVMNIHASHGILRVDNFETGVGFEYVLARNYNKDIVVEIYPIRVSVPVVGLSKKLEPIYPVQFKLLNAIDQKLKETRDKDFANDLIRVREHIIEKCRTIQIGQLDQPDIIALIATLIKPYSPVFYSLLVKIICQEEESNAEKKVDTTHTESEDRTYLHATISEYKAFGKLKTPRMFQDKVNAVREMKKSAEFLTIKKIVNIQGGDERINDVIYDMLSFNNLSVKPLVKRLMHSSCTLTDDLTLFVKYFAEEAVFKWFLKIAKIYFSLKDYTPFCSFPGFFGKVKANRRDIVIQVIETSLCSNNSVSINLEDFDKRLKRLLLGVYNYRNPMETDMSSRYFRDVIRPNFLKKF